MNTEKLRAQAPDLNTNAPRSPYVALGEGFPAVAARVVDKCRAELLGQIGPYQFNCPMDQKFLVAAGLEAESLKEFVATGADDHEVAAWMEVNATAPKEKILSWGRRFRMNPLWLLLRFEDWLHRRRHGRNRG